MASWTEPVGVRRGVRDFLVGWRRRDAVRPLAPRAVPPQVQAWLDASTAATTGLVRPGGLDPALLDTSCARQPSVEQALQGMLWS